MSEAGIYTLVKALVGGISAIATGPMGGVDLPKADLATSLTVSRPGIVAELITERGELIGSLDASRGGSASDQTLHPLFVPALLATEDARFHSHPGIDPFAMVSALRDTLSGSPRGGSSLAQQLVKNQIIGSERSLERKIAEGIIAIRATHHLGSEKLLEGYLGHTWFGRGSFGATSASLSWFGVPWSDLEIQEVALLAGALKGPSRYDHHRHPGRARERMQVVLGRMEITGLLDPEEVSRIAQAPFRSVVRYDDQVDPWIVSAATRDLQAEGLPPSDQARITLTISKEWQNIAQRSLRETLTKLGGEGPAGRLPEELIHSMDQGEIRRAASAFVEAGNGVGRAIVVSLSQEPNVLIDAGFGSMGREIMDLPADAKVGDVYGYRSTNDVREMITSPKINGAVVVMEPATGAILAYIGGGDPELSRFDRTRAMRQPGSAIKPFLWARALEAGYAYDEMISDTVQSYRTPSGEVWTPRNYDRSQTGFIPLFVALEESSNQVAARLVDQIGVASMAEITEAAGVYPTGGMRLHPSSSLGASETDLVSLVAGYASIANGGMRVRPHVINLIQSGNGLLVPSVSEEFPVMTRETAGLVTSMLYGVTVRGTAARAFGSTPPVAGKTGTTQNHRDSWFVGYTPDLVIGVWIGRDDNLPLPGRTTGASGSAPVVSAILKAAQEAGLTRSPGRTTEGGAWPPVPLSARAIGGRQYTREGTMIFEPDPDARRRAIERGGDPFKNPHYLLDQIRDDLGVREREVNSNGVIDTPFDAPEDRPDYLIGNDPDGQLMGFGNPVFRN